MRETKGSGPGCGSRHSFFPYAAPHRAVMHGIFGRRRDRCVRVPHVGGAARSEPWPSGIMFSALTAENAGLQSNGGIGALSPDVRTNRVSWLGGPWTTAELSRVRNVLAI